MLPKINGRFWQTCTHGTVEANARKATAALLTAAENEAFGGQTPQGHPGEDGEAKTNLFRSHTAVNYSLLLFPAALPGGSNLQSYQKPRRSHPLVGRHRWPPAQSLSFPRVNPKRSLRVPRKALQRQGSARRPAAPQRPQPSAGEQGQLQPAPQRPYRPGPRRLHRRRAPSSAAGWSRGWPAPSPTARRPAAPPRAPATSRRAPGPPQRLGPSRRAEGGAGEAAGPGRAVPQGHGDNSAPWRPGPLMAAGRRCAAAVAPRAGPRLCKEEIASSSPSRGAAAFWFSFNPGMIYLLCWCGALIPVGAFVHRCETNRYGLAELPRPCAHRGGMASFWALGGLQQVERRETKRGQGHERWRDVSFPPACSASSFRRPAPWEHALLFPIY